MELVVARGIRHSGNGDWATKWAAESKNRVHLSHEMVQAEMFGDVTEVDKAMKEAVSVEFQDRVENALDEGKDVVVEILGLSPSGLRHYRNIAKRHSGTNLSIKTFDIDLEDALTRHRNSNDVAVGVPERAIREMHDRFVNKPIPEDMKEHIID